MNNRVSGQTLQTSMCIFSTKIKNSKRPFLLERKILKNNKSKENREKLVAIQYEAGNYSDIIGNDEDDSTKSEKIDDIRNNAFIQIMKNAFEKKDLQLISKTLPQIQHAKEFRVFYLEYLNLLIEQKDWATAHQEFFKYLSKFVKDEMSAEEKKILSALSTKLLEDGDIDKLGSYEILLRKDDIFLGLLLNIVLHAERSQWFEKKYSKLDLGDRLLLLSIWALLEPKQVQQFYAKEKKIRAEEVPYVLLTFRIVQKNWNPDLDEAWNLRLGFLKKKQLNAANKQYLLKLSRIKWPDAKTPSDKYSTELRKIMDILRESRSEIIQLSTQLSLQEQIKIYDSSREAESKCGQLMVIELNPEKD